MMLLRKTLVLLGILASPFSYSQTEKPQQKAALQTFKTQYNTDDYQGFFESLIPALQKELPLSKVAPYFKAIKEECGNILELQSVGEKGGLTRYKATGVKEAFTLLFSANAANKIDGFQISAYEEVPTALPAEMARNTTKMALPFKGTWSVFWGGDTEAQNAHIVSKAQRGAFDIVMFDEEGSSHKGEGKRNEDYYCFGQPLLAPCAAEVVLVVEGIKDNVPGALNPVYVPGNTVVLKTAAGEYLFFAHFKQYSTKVKPGQKVKTGEVLGLCGNSGNSSEPHLHFHVQDGEEMTEATGMKCYFQKIKVNGKVAEDYSPVKSDKVENL